MKTSRTRIIRFDNPKAGVLMIPALACACAAVPDQACLRLTVPIGAPEDTKLGAGGCGRRSVLPTAGDLP